ncbi:hypothetical protein BZG01_18965 [Labilibaculum manganireducens]|uniref:Outer membrane protein beta-barrel domain-containing protein n=1 Tax=Labilibaculum manganireducens TaxID=1940525 RepID=A0A2N3HUA9_9BACT|nr:hypothetical protein [Labilibaculum manganireducens]PKQ61627.1 hypothetical protein BZG01_18965 [Labilibaculum manganireducens]
MRKLILTGLAIAFGLLAMAQEKTKQREVGLSFSNLDQFGIIYKVGDEKALWRFNAVSLGGSENKSENLLDSESEDTRNSFGFGLGFGREFRKVIATSLEFRYGLDLRYNYSKYENQNDNSVYNSDSKTNRLGLDFVVGLTYDISDKLVFGAELSPGVGYSISKQTTKNSDGDISAKSETKNFSYGLSNSSAQLTLAYRF